MTGGTDCVVMRLRNYDGSISTSQSHGKDIGDIGLVKVEKYLKLNKQLKQIYFRSQVKMKKRKLVNLKTVNSYVLCFLI